MPNAARTDSRPCITAPVIQSSATTAPDPSARGAKASVSENQSNGTDANSATVKCAAAKPRVPRDIGGSKRRTLATSNGGFCQWGPAAVAGCQPGGMNQTANLSRQRGARHDLRARSA